MKSIHVKTGRPYDVFIRKGIIDSLGDVVSNEHKKAKVAVICDKTVFQLHYAKAYDSLRKCNLEVYPFSFLSGEESKNVTTYLEIIEFLADNGFAKSDVVVALGGGVVGDIAGFAAATYMRGLGFFQVPTTFLSMIDASVGGKNGVDLIQGKNLLGTINQPETVLCDTELLRTLPESAMRDGTAEAIKCGVIRDKKLFDIIVNENPRAKCDEIVYRCIDIKRSIVERDELDNGERLLLNFGHTFGHAIEKLSGYKITHGKAVAIGMAMMARAAYNLKLSTENCTPAIEEVLEKYLLPTETEFSSGELIKIVLSDKKRRGDVLNVIMPVTIGKAEIVPIREESLNLLAEAAMKG